MLDQRPKALRNKPVFIVQGKWAKQKGSSLLWQLFCETYLSTPCLPSFRHHIFKMFYSPQLLVISFMFCVCGQIPISPDSLGDYSTTFMSILSTAKLKLVILSYCYYLLTYWDGISSQQPVEFYH